MQQFGPGLGRDHAERLRPGIKAFGGRPVRQHHLMLAEQEVEVFDPLVGAQLLDLPSMLGRADFVIVCCALTTQTHHLIGETEFRQMKPSAHLINVARGPIVDQKALTGALQQGEIAGAALDVFEREPVDLDDPLLGLENVILAPHALSWTDESFRMMGESAFAGILAIARGKAPDHVVNRNVLDSSAFKKRIAACAGRATADEES